MKSRMVISMAAPRSGYVPELSFRLDTRSLEDWPPFLDLGLVEGGEAPRRLLLARGHIEPEIGEFLLHLGIGEGLDHCSVQLRNNLARRAFRCEEGEPAGDVEARQPRFVGAGNA